MSVKRCQREVDSAEFAEWMAYSMHEPFGPEREDQRAGVVAALIANVNRDSKRRSEPYDVEDFFPRWGAEPEEAEKPDLQSKLMAWAKTMQDNPTLKGDGRRKGRDGRANSAGEAAGDGKPERVPRRGRGGQTQAG